MNKFNKIINQNRFGTIKKHSKKRTKKIQKIKIQKKEEDYLRKSNE
jgi:hypothetical protein